MKHKIFSFSMLAAALAGLTACSQKDEFATAGGRQPVRLTASTTTVTRAADGIYTDAGFSGGEQAEVFMYDGSASTHATYDIAAPAAGSSDLTIASGQTALDYPEDESTAVTLYAVYPATSTASHVVKRDQSTDDAYRQSDLMYAKTSVADRSATQSLMFEHKLVKLKFSITKPADVSVLGNVTLLGVKRKVTVTPSATGMTLGTATAVESTDDDYSSDADVNNSILVAGGEASNASAQTYTYACVLPANEWAAGDAFLSVVLDGQLVTYKVDAAQSLSGGTEYVLTLNASKNAVSDDQTTASLSAWGSITEAEVLAPTDANALTIGDITAPTWTGAALTPAVTVSKNGTTLTKDTHYTVAYFNNVNAGTEAVVVVTGKDDYAGKVGIKKFTIEKKTDGAISFATASGSKTYGDAAFLINDIATFSNTGDGTVTYSSSNTTVATVDENTGEVTIVKPGTATITATAANTANCEYSTATATFELTVDKKTVTLTPASPAALAFTSSDAVDATVTSTESFVCSEGAGHITVSSSNESNFTVSYDTSTQKITITRKNASAFSDGSVTVSTNLSADYYELPTDLTVAVSAEAASVETAGNGFSISSSDKVMFAPGNLQATYDGSSWTWKFAEHQYDYIGNAAANTSIDGNGTVSSNGTVDLFGWVGNSSTVLTSEPAKYGISKSTTDSDYGTSTSDALKSDWGNLTITNAGTYSWRTLTGGDNGEWKYIFSTRSSGATVNGTTDARYTHATINTDGTPVNGMILFPDGCTIENSSATSWGAINGNSAWGTKCTKAQWTHLESLGCVFLPAAGGRNGSTVYDAGTDGYYWSSSPYASDVRYAYYVYFYSGYLFPANSSNRYGGRSVRLVRQVE